jgi:hypothetical protein
VLLTWGVPAFPWFPRSFWLLLVHGLDSTTESLLHTVFGLARRCCTRRELTSLAAIRIAPKTNTSEVCLFFLFLCPALLKNPSFRVSPLGTCLRYSTWMRDS